MLASKGIQRSSNFKQFDEHDEHDEDSHHCKDV
jgi:hypothetical protein